MISSDSLGPPANVRSPNVSLPRTTTRSDATWLPRISTRLESMAGMVSGPVSWIVAPGASAVRSMSVSSKSASP